jgi:hypothetical protein
MRRTVRILVLLAAALITTNAYSPSLCAYPYDREYITKYYSDATYTTVIGGRITDCCGETVFWGQYSTYRIEEEGPCDDCFPGTGW